ncbi:hypothetical protein M1512_01020, partial [Patescibacteria group bacterium]|nr:hypothetical protein [Patescibacteria group bacterium]
MKMGLFDNIKAKQKEHQEKAQELNDTRGDKLRKLNIGVSYLGGYKDIHANNGGSLTFYKNVTDYNVIGVSKRSFSISNKDIANISFEGKDDVVQQRTITRNVLLAGKSKKQAVKDTYLTIELTSGEKASFHIKDKAPLELKASLSNVIMHVVQGKPQDAPTSTGQASTADELSKLAKLKQQGI